LLHFGFGTAHIADQYVAPGGSSAWGMTVVQEPDTGLFHGFVSEFKNKCKLGSWTTNSFVNHVVSPSPEGPWDQKGQVVGVWSHNPKVVYSKSDKTWLMYHIGTGVPVSGPEQNCNDTDSAFSDGHPRPRGSGSGTGPFVIHSATSLDGAWSLVPEAFNYTETMTSYPGYVNLGQGGGSLLGEYASASDCQEACQALGESACTSYTWMGKNNHCMIRTDYFFEPTMSSSAVTGRPWTFRGDNPTAYIEEDGSVRVLYRTDSTGGEAASAGYDVASMIGQAHAPHWSGPYSSLSAFGGPISAPMDPYEENEDPFIWKNSRGYHGLFHACTWTNSRGTVYPAAKWAGRYAHSVDGLEWTFSPIPAYNSTIQWANGTTAVFSRMERPFLIFDNTGNPTHLFNGVQEYEWDQYTFNLVHKIRSKSTLVI